MGFSRGKIKRDIRDDKFSKLIRLAANWTCQKCGKYYPEGRGRAGLHCSHFYGRARRSVRWHPWNAASHCSTCHGYLESNPIIFDHWIYEYLGKERYDKLRIIQNGLSKWTKHDLELINKHLHKELKKMEAIKANGNDEFYFFKAYE